MVIIIRCLDVRRFNWISNNLPYCFLTNFGIDDEPNLVKDWCIEQFGKSQTESIFSEYRKWRWSPINPMMIAPPFKLNKSNRVRVYVSFRYEEAATLFKLRWL